MTHKQFNSKAAGFTLVELAIVLMIIGLLIGGILRGQELMQNARVTTTAQQVTAYVGAIATFQDAYGAPPGDLATAPARVPNCTSANSCQGGNGDGVIGLLVPGNQAAENQPWYDVPTAVTSENAQFWKHLAAAHLISGVSPNAVTPEFGASNPPAKMGGGFFVRQTNFNTPGFPSWAGTILVLRNTVSGAWQCGGGGNPTALCAASPMRAAQLDRKLDDGAAISGDTRAISANWTSGCGIANSNGQNAAGYLESSEIAACDMMFHVF